MPWAPEQRCLARGCCRRQGEPYCRDHARLSPRNHHGVPRQARGLGVEFERAKRLVIERYGGRCQLRLAGCTVVATTADHIVPRSRGGTAHPSNLRASCTHCNSARGDRHTDTQVVQSSVTSVTRVTDEAGRGIGSLAGLAEARTAWQPHFRAAGFRVFVRGLSLRGWPADAVRAAPVDAPSPATRNADSPPDAYRGLWASRASPGFALSVTDGEGR